MPGIKLTDLGPLPVLNSTSLFYVVNDVNASFKIDAASLGGSLRTVETLSLKTPIDQGVSAWTTTNTYSAAWQSTYTVVNANSANWILDGGNTKSAALSVGTKDSYNLNFITNNARQAIITDTGALSVTNKAYSSSTANSDPGGTLVTKDYVLSAANYIVSSTVILPISSINIYNVFFPGTGQGTTQQNLALTYRPLTGYGTTGTTNNYWSFTVPVRGPLSNIASRPVTIQAIINCQLQQCESTTYFALCNRTTDEIIDINSIEGFGGATGTTHAQKAILLWTGALNIGSTYELAIMVCNYLPDDNTGKVVVNGVQTKDAASGSMSPSTFAAVTSAFSYNASKLVIRYD